MGTSKEYFDRLGASWDELREAFYSSAVRDTALAVAGVQPGTVAADLGAGTGFITSGLVARGVRVIAVDQSAAMLQALRRKFPRLDQVDCRVGDAERLPIENGAVDYALANMYLHHVESPFRAVAEMVRILRPGGKLVVTDLDSHEFEFLKTEHHDRWMGFKRGEVRTWFTRAGLAGVNIGSVGEQCRTESQDGLGAAIGIFVASGVRLRNTGASRRSP